MSAQFTTAMNMMVKTKMALRSCRWWTAAMVFIISSTTNSYSLLHDRRLMTRMTSHSSFVYRPPPSERRRPPGRGNARGERAPPMICGGGNGDDSSDVSSSDRRNLIGSVASSAASFGLRASVNGLLLLLVGAPKRTAAATTTTTAVPDDPQPGAGGGLEVIKTPSGLKYVDLVAGTGRTPRYGELLSIVYTGYIKLPSGNVKKYSSEPQKFDQVTDGYLVKHGNGKTVAGLDEGLHTMREGGTRRILIPPKLGFVDIGLGPLPESSWNRDRLNRLLDQMVELSGGTLIYEVTLKSIIIDEADQGYYEDETISPENFAKLRANMQQQAAEAKLAQEALERQPKNADKVM